MNRFWKLVHLEVHRFRYILAALMGLVFVIQMGAIIWTVRSGLSAMGRAAAMGGPISGGNGLFPGEGISFAWVIFNTQKLFILSILLTIAVLVLYVFGIWYRDWFGRSATVYRLLMLPTARRHLYLAKLAAVLLFVFFMLSYQLGLLVLGDALTALLVPAEYYAVSPFSDATIANQAFYALLLPRHPAGFALYYGAGTLAVVVAFTGVLLERSYRGIGIAYGLLYAIGCFAVVLGPPLLWGLGDERAMLYPIEIVVLMLVAAGLVAAGSLWLSFRLLEKRMVV